MRQFLYNVRWPRQNNVMNVLAKRIEAARALGDGAAEDDEAREAKRLKK